MAQKQQQFDYDIIVIGSGAGGSIAATLAAKDGKRVAIIEANTFGGESPNWGDVPTKALLHAASLYDEAKKGMRFGIRSSMLGYNYPSLLAWKDLAVKRTGAGGNRHYYEKQGISAYHGIAHFLSPHEISVSRRHLSAAKFLIATGSHWDIPGIIGLDKLKYYTPKTILSLNKPPKSLFIIGGSTRAVELAQLFATFGTKVFIADIHDRILSSEDEEVGTLIAKLLSEQKGVTVLTGTRILSTTKDGIMKRVSYLRGGVEKSIKVDDILLAGERVPTVDIGLENAGVDYSAKGVEASNTLQTTQRHIFAAGDVLGGQSYTHSAMLEGRIAAHNMLRRTPIEPDYTATPRVTFLSPEVASVGLNEEDCLRRDLAIVKSMVPLSIVGRANVSDCSDGFVKLIANKKGQLLGGTIVAPHAGEMIHEIGLAIKYGLTAKELSELPHAFLSWSEAVRAAAAKLG